MTNWFNKIKKLLAGYLATEDDKYLTTEDGLKLWIIDHEWRNKDKKTNTFVNAIKKISNWSNKSKN